MMSKTYHLAMVQDKKGGFGTFIKAGLVITAAYLAYKNLGSKDDDAQASQAGKSTIGAGVDKAAKEASDFAAKVLKAAKKVAG
jgi:hypothetical protein